MGPHPLVIGLNIYKEFFKEVNALKKKFQKTGNCLLAFLLSAVMLFSVIPAVTVYAEAETETEAGTYDVSQYKVGEDQTKWTYPDQDGMVFAGWFTDSTCTTPHTETTGTAYAKFVDANVMKVAKQLNSAADAMDDTVNIRFLTAIKDTRLKSVSFHVTLSSKSFTMTETKAYSSVLEDGTAVATTASSLFGTDATYFVVHTLGGVPNEYFDDTFTATVSWVTLDGTTVTSPWTENTDSYSYAFKLNTYDEFNLSLSASAIRSYNKGITAATSDSSVTLTVGNGSESGGMFQIGTARYNASSWEVGATISSATVGVRRGVGVVTPEGSLLFYVSDTQAGYVTWHTLVDKDNNDTRSAAVSLTADVQAIVAAGNYTVKAVATGIDDAGTGTVSLYVNNTLVYTFTNNHVQKSDTTPALNLSAKILPSIGAYYGASADTIFTDWYYKIGAEVPQVEETWTTLDPLPKVSGTGFINYNGSLDRTQESSGIVTLATNTGSADNQILLQFANAAQNISAFEISTAVTEGTGRRGVGLKTPDGYLFFNVVENGGANGAGYVEFDVNTNGNKKAQAYQTLDAAAEAVITSDEAYTLKIVAENLTGEATDTITFYVNEIPVYTYTNTLGFNLTAKVLPAIGVRGGGRATFTDYTFKVMTMPKTVKMTYDDRYTFDAAIASIETISVTSNQVGTENPDTAVLAVAGNDSKTCIAVGVGTAEVTLANGDRYRVAVSPATISVALIAGQSNAEGWGTEAKRKLSIACPDGQVYSTYGFSNTDFARINGITATASDALSETTAQNFVATSLTSNVSYGGTKLLYPLNSMTKSGKGKIGIDSGLAYEWNKRTGEKIWVVNCGHGGSSITTWVPGGTNYKECIALMSYVKQTMEAEIAAGHYTLSKFMYFWCQGEADNSWMGQADYHKNLKLVHNGLKADLTLNGQTLDYGGNIIVYANGENSGELDIADTGVRLAQKQACAETTGDFADFYMACDVNERWVKDEDVAAYWETKYPNSVYPFTFQEGTYQNPTTVAEVEGDKIHYMAPAYNEIGIVCAEHAYVTLFEETD